MHRYLDEYPPAPQSRISDAEQLFPYRSMSAEEYAARYGRNWFCFSFGEYVYPDPVLNEWVHALDDILFEPGRLERVERRYLTEDEISENRKRSAAF